LDWKARFGWTGFGFGFIFGFWERVCTDRDGGSISKTIGDGRFCFYYYLYHGSDGRRVVDRWRWPSREERREGENINNSALRWINTIGMY